jgi:hypothetical protein
MPTKKNPKTRRKNNERCLALPDQPFLRPEGVFSVVSSSPKNVITVKC